MARDHGAEQQHRVDPCIRIEQRHRGGCEQRAAQRRAAATTFAVDVPRLPPPDRRAQREQAVAGEIGDAGPERGRHHAGMPRQHGRQALRAEHDQQRVAACADDGDSQQMGARDRAFDDEGVLGADRREQAGAKQQAFEESGGVEHERADNLLS